VIGLFSSCGTYYQRTKSTEQAIVAGDYSQAKKEVANSRYLSRKRNNLLYAIEMGKVCHLKGEFKESNKFFEYADYKMQLFKSVGDHALGVLVNQALQSYQIESHERIMVHYYKALNYMQLGDVEEALVEARKLNLVQKSMSVSAKGKTKKYHQDPFGLLLMGMLYEADNDYNNAFIAYRNAKEVYESDQTGLFSNNAPSHLESDIARSAKLSGISYESEIEPNLNLTTNGELILFWENGLSPIKEEKNIFFSLAQNKDGFFFESDGLIIPTDYDFAKNDPDFKVEDLGLIRLARSYYVNRYPQTLSMDLFVNDEAVKMEMGADISALAFQVERDNYVKELAADLLRLTLKKISEKALSEESEVAGALMNVGNFASEKADTRNWQSLPSQIQFARIPLKEGLNKITIRTSTAELIEMEVMGTGRLLFRNVVTY